MHRFSSESAEVRQSQRLAVPNHPRLQLTLDGTAPDSDLIEGVTLCDISHQGLMASNGGMLVPGARIEVDIPLVGRRDAKVIWIADDRAGCRLGAPLALHELRLAAAGSQRLAELCPTLRERIIAFALPAYPANGVAPSSNAPTDAFPGRISPALIMFGLIALGTLAFFLTGRLLAG